VKRAGVPTRSTVHIADDTVRNFPKCHGLDRARSPKGLDFNMAVSEEFNFVICASEGHHNGVADALEANWILPSCSREMNSSSCSRLFTLHLP
jgi:hypothetical protein